jgi:hypothetical protein
MREMASPGEPERNRNGNPNAEGAKPTTELKPVYPHRA